ncbi:MAG: prephenate dehydrogenase [Lachnospiraceae bacterium]|nr:prephenate dehydrogenase [Lachnospiraceae bacterium]
MNWISDNNILIVGLGLMGGSYAKGLKRLGYKVEAIDTKESSIEYAKDNGLIDNGYAYPDENAIRKADAIIFALYPGIIKEWIEKYQHLFKYGVRITDVTGVKSCIVYDIQKMLRDDIEFVPSHPMAGREVYGVENADDAMFRGANFIVAPTERNTGEGIEWCKSLGKILGFRKISVLTPEEHDDMIGFVSQLTHVIAVSLMTCSDNTHLVDYTGDSFRDLTRIASINEEMWSELFHMNKDALLKHMDDFIGEMSNFRDLLAADDIEGMKDKMRLSTKRHSYFIKK